MHHTAGDVNCERTCFSLHGHKQTVTLYAIRTFHLLDEDEAEEEAAELGAAVSGKLYANTLSPDGPTLGGAAARDTAPTEPECNEEIGSFSGLHIERYNTTAGFYRSF